MQISTRLVCCRGGSICGTTLHDMGATIIDGAAVAAELRSNVAKAVEQLKESRRAPCLATVLVGENPASLSYIRGKQRACRDTGVDAIDIRLPADTEQASVLDQVRELNERKDVDGILVQSPLPSHINEEAIVATIDPAKDVDGFHPTNLGNLLRGNPALLPCTPYGIVKLLQHGGVAPTGKRVVILGRSLLVGRPLAALLMRRGADATVTVCHSKTADIAAHTHSADILVSAIGTAEYVTADMVAPGATVIDVGINRVPDASRKRGYRLVGDVHFESVSPVAGAITPVPGGVGPMTVAVLLLNTLQAARGCSTEEQIGGG